MFVGAHNIISPLGWTSNENFEKVRNGVSAIEVQSVPSLSDSALPLSLIKEEEVLSHCATYPDLAPYSRLEQLSILSLKQVVDSVDVKSKKTGFILSTTKGNIRQLEDANRQPQLWLGETAQRIASYFGFENTPHVISNACISGIAAMVVAKRFIQSGQYNQVVILGVDELSKFIVSGFQSFQSLSANPCKPFDKHRDGLTLGEGVASIVITKNRPAQQGCLIELVNGAIANDANHISGPSRSGEGLYRAIKQTIARNEKVDVICAHGTATPYNDDMESYAIFRAGYASVPVFSLKGFFGHTLGAAGVIETIISIMALEQNMVLGTKGLQEQGVAQPITVTKQNSATQTKGLLKLMSGFGGCNAAAYFLKHE